MPVAVATFRALGMQVQIGCTDESTIGAADQVVREFLADLDAAVSRFRDDSELSRLNAAAGATAPVSSLLWEALQVAVRVAETTGGLVDPTVGAAVEAAGYDRDIPEVQARAAAGPLATASAPGIAGFRAIQLDAAALTVTVPPGTHVDLGSSAKAFAADRCAARSAAVTDAGVLVNIGGDLSVAGRPPAAGWQVRVTDDHNAPPDAPGQTVAIHSGALATSSTTVRRWRSADGAAHHIVDPRTGRPALTVWRTVSAVAATCVEANAATTAAVILGDGAIPWLIRRGIPARLVDNSGRVVTVCGWPEDSQQ